MSKILYESDLVTVSSHVGPATMGADRRMIQITARDGNYIEMSHQEFLVLVDAFGLGFRTAVRNDEDFP